MLSEQFDLLTICLPSIAVAYTWAWLCWLEGVWQYNYNILRRAIDIW